MGKHRNLLTLILIAALALVLVGIAFELLADGTGGWVAAYIAILALGSGITVALWLRRVHRSLASVRRIATDTANAMNRTEQRVTEANQTLGALGVRLIAVHELQGEVLRELRSGPVSSEPGDWPSDPRAAA